jgi:hypothetical protein
MGEGNCFIRTNFSSNRTFTNQIPKTDPPGGTFIRIHTAYPNAWNESLHNLLGMYVLKGYIDITLDPVQGYIEVIPVTRDIWLQLNVIQIYVQIGQGWIL